MMPAGAARSAPMWTLVIIVLANGASPSSGSGSAISALNFVNQQECSEAAAQVAGSGNVGGDRGGPYQIIAKCVQRSTSGGAKH
jgi:hypothetical protein